MTDTKFLDGVLICTIQYCGTLAHKCCHSFKNNAEFVELRHPRYGLIMSVVALRDILPHEEIFVSYNYR